ncbi:hypothetical protein X546_20505 [Brevibacillus borstelensis cifa_chp40]|nr:hypothetical protein X546_20505 [Brevibacillus borstelensis cifa_chp40]
MSEEKIPYLNRIQQEQVLLLTLNVVTLEELANQEKFKFAAGDLRRARTFAQKGYDAIKDRLDPHDHRKIARLADQSKIVIRSKT